jgi:hypothetical protein
MSTPISASGSIYSLNQNGAPILSAFGGKIQTPTSNIKQFFTSNVGDSWFYKKINSKIYLTPTNQSSSLNVLIPGNLIVQGTITNASSASNFALKGHINNPTDLTLKENIQTITEETYNNILKIEPKSYFLEDDPEKKEHYGIIAEELELIFPELIEQQNPGEDQTNTHINYLELIPLLIGKMKQMQEEINELKASI